MRSLLSAAFFCVLAIQPALASIQAVVQRGGEWTAAAAGDCKPADQAWVWSEEAAPALVEGAQWPAVCKSRALDRSTRKLSVHVVPYDRRAVLAIVAAPIAMWREVPEPLLPRLEWKHPRVLSVPRDAKSAWRVRAVGEAEGSGWLDVPVTHPKVVLGSAAAATRVLRLVTSDGHPAADATVEVVRQRGSAQAEVIARYVSDARGVASMPALPDLPPLHFLTHHAAHAADAFSASTAELPLTRRLEAGAHVRGRVLDGDEPLSGVTVALETWAAGNLAKILNANATTGADGSFTIGHLPRGAAAMVVSKPGFIPHRDTLELKGAGLDLDPIRLERGAAITLRVLDDAGQSIAGARIDAGSGRVATADAEGKAVLKDAPTTRPVRVTVSADGHLEESADLRPPFEDASIRLQRGFVVKGTVSDADGVPVSAALVRIENGSSYSVEETQDDGTFAFTLKPGTDVKLVFASPAANELVVPVAAGTAGEIRDLGTLRAPKGLSVTGRVVGPDGSPVAGARVWSPKQSPLGPLVAFMNNELVEASSSADGTFSVSGLQALPVLLRVDAPGYARTFLELQLDGSVPSVSAGDVVLTHGATVRVRTRVTDAVARVDPRGESLEIDILSAAVRDRVATVPHVPSGSATVTIFRDRRTVCEKRITIDRDDLTVDCDPIDTLVRGSVLVGATPARGGKIMWTPATTPRVGAAIMERRSPNGLRQQQVWGAGDAALMTELDDAGRFETRELRPGRWNVSYGGPAQPVEIPELEEFEVSLRFSDTVVSGVVVDGNGKPVPRALVEIRSANAVTMTGDDGTFELRGLAAGEHDVRARSREGRTAAERVRIEEGRPMPPLRLVLQETPAAEVRIAVTRRGVPAAGAFVFADLENEGQRVLTTDADGMAILRIGEDSRATRVRVAAFADGLWSFGGWRGRDQRSLSVPIEDGGSLSITGASGEIEIVRADGWTVSQLLRRLGLPPYASASAPFVLSGLAPGTYTVAARGRTMQADVTAGRKRELDFR